MENQKRRELPTSSARKNLKRKLDEDFERDRKIATLSPHDANQDLILDVRTQLEILDSTFSSIDADRAAAKLAIHVLSEFAKNEEIVSVIVDCGAVPALVRHLQAPPSSREGDTDSKPHEHEVEKGSAFTLGLLAVKPEHQQLIVDAGALPHLVDLLKRHRYGKNSKAVNGVIRRAADAITNLAHENSSIKTRVRIEGGIPPLVELLEFIDSKVQRAAAGALRTLAFKNDENKNQIVECNALPTLILMLRSEDAAIHYEAVGVIGNLVHSSPNIKREVLLAGALQPVISLLSSCCSESQREAALLLGQFAATDSDCKVHIVQRGAVQPLIEMLQSPDAQLREMSAFALGRLAQDTHNQAGIAHSGGIEPLLKLLDSKNGSLQHNAAFALYGLADNEDNVADLIRFGGIQRLQDGEFIVQPTRDCVAKTLKRLEEKIHGRILSYLLYLMRVAEKVIQSRIALALAHLCLPDDQKAIFIDNNGLELLLELLESTTMKHQRDGSMALYKLATKVNSVSPVDAAPPSPTPQVYLGEQYVNNSTLSDVTFLVEGKRFYAHRICLLASSDTFRAMFDGGYREKDAKDVEIPNIRWDVFELMMRYIYTGSVDVNLDIAQELLRAADQYLLEGLKRLCEYAIAQELFKITSGHSLFGVVNGRCVDDPRSKASDLNVYSLSGLDIATNRDIIGIALANLIRLHWKRASRTNHGLMLTSPLRPVHDANDKLSKIDGSNVPLVRPQDLRLAIMASERLLILQPHNWTLRRDHGLMLYYSREYEAAVQELSICMAFAPEEEAGVLEPFVEKLHLLRLESSWKSLGHNGPLRVP